MTRGLRTLTAGRPAGAPAAGGGRAGLGLLFSFCWLVGQGQGDLERALAVAAGVPPGVPALSAVYFHFVLEEGT